MQSIGTSLTSLRQGSEKSWFDAEKIKISQKDIRNHNFNAPGWTFTSALCFFAEKTLMKISDISAQDRPRERMMSHGPRALSNAELLAIIIRTGTGKENAVELAHRVLALTGGRLSEMQVLSMERLCTISGIKKAKAMQIVAALEFSRRIAEDLAYSSFSTIDGPEDAYRHLRPLFASDRVEECWCLFLKKNSKVLGSMFICRGGESVTSIDNRTIIRKALDLGAKGVIISHNHPSGIVEPSKEDIKATECLQNALETCDLMLMDHIILGENSYYSMSANKTYRKSGKKCNNM